MDIRSILISYESVLAEPSSIIEFTVAQFEVGNTRDVSTKHERLNIKSR